MGNLTPLLSVIMPVYNCEKFVAEAIESILNQTFTNFELLIADDGSSDMSRRIIDRYTDPRVRTKHSATNQGKSTIVNKLFREAIGQFVTIHDADDVSLPVRLATQIREFDRNPRLVLCGTNYYTTDVEGQIVSKSRLSDVSDMLKGNLFHESQFHGPTVVFRRDVAMKLGEIYRPFFRDYNEDYDFTFRLSDLGEVTNCQEHLYKYRITPKSLSRTLTVQKRVSVKLVQHLAQQRRQSGTDDLLSNRYGQLGQLCRELSRPYERDKSLIFRDQAELDFYYGFHKNALISSFRAIIAAPFVFRNYRLMQHILRKRIFGY